MNLLTSPIFDQNPQRCSWRPLCRTPYQSRKAQAESADHPSCAQRGKFRDPILRLSPIASRLSTRISNNSPRHSNTNCATMPSIGISTSLWSSAAFPMFSSQEYRDFDVDFSHTVGPLQSPVFSIDAFLSNPTSEHIWPTWDRS